MVLMFLADEIGGCGSAEKMGVGCAVKGRCMCAGGGEGMGGRGIEEEKGKKERKKRGEGVQGAGGVCEEEMGEEWSTCSGVRRETLWKMKTDAGVAEAACCGAREVLARAACCG